MNTITVPFQGPIEKLLDKAAREAAATGAKFTGNTRHGKVESSDFCISYDVHERTIVFTVEDKPFYVPLSMIESKLKEWLV